MAKRARNPASGSVRGHSRRVHRDRWASRTDSAAGARAAPAGRAAQAGWPQATGRAEWGDRADPVGADRAATGRSDSARGWVGKDRWALQHFPKGVSLCLEGMTTTMIAVAVVMVVGAAGSAR